MQEEKYRQTRRKFITAALGLAGMALAATPGWALWRRGLSAGGNGSGMDDRYCHPGRPAGGAGKASLDDHPEPRPGIDASRVMTREQLADYPDVVDAYDGIREIPQIADGIRCHCGCAELPGYRSLLVCYEGGGMARFCDICQGEGRLAYRLHKRGRTLDQIRKAIDARYG